MHIVAPRFGFAGYPSGDSSGRTNPEPAAPNDPSVAPPGVIVGIFKPYVFVPLTLQLNNIVTSAVVNGAATLTAGTGVTTNTTFRTGQTLLDITGGVFERSVRVTGVAGTSAVNFTVVGYDMYGQLTTNTFLGPAGATTTESIKCFRYILSVTSAATTTNTVTVGTGDTYGMPTTVTNFDQFVNLYWNTAGITATTGFTAADATSPATAATGHVRGRYAVQSASDGTKRLAAYIYVPNPDNVTNAYGVLPV